MKTIVTAVLFLLILSIGIITAAAVVLSGDITDVRLTEITHQGDIAAAKGLTVTAQNTWSNYAFWTTAHKIGYADDAVTDFDFSSIRRSNPGGDSREYLLLESSDQRGFDFTAALEEFGITLGEAEARNFDIPGETRSFREAATDPALGLTAAYNELYMEAVPGEERKKIVHLSDYYDYYPLNLIIHLPGVIWTNNDVTPSTVAEKGTEAYVVQYFRDYFKIPMLDEVLEIHFLRTSDHGMSWGSSTVDGVVYSFYTLSAADSQNCYFTFNTQIKDGCIDTSEIRGGYGIYRLPYRKGTSTTDIGIDPEALEMVYPLAEGTVIEGLYFNHSQTRLLLVTCPDDKTVQVDIIDPITYECMQTFTVGGSFFRDLMIYENYTVAVTEDRLMVLTEDNGIYTPAFTAFMPTDENGDIDPITSRHVTAFDGTRLAAAANDYNMGNERCSYDVTVYSAKGILWHGTVETTLDIGRRPREYHSRYDIVPFYGAELAIAWE